MQLAFDTSRLGTNDTAFENSEMPAAAAELHPPATPADCKLDICEGMLDVVSALFNVSGKELRKPGRTALCVARVRQIAMYVTHCALGLTMTDVGRGFGRDRTTVLHACHLVEDLRDDDEFDRIVTTVERVAVAAFGSRYGVVR